MTDGHATHQAGELPTDFPPVMTVDQVADYLQVSKRKVYDMAAAGDIPAAKVGDQWRFFRPEIDRWLVGLSRANVGDPTPVDPSPDAGDASRVYNGTV